jgi:hypothetical protein
LTPPLREARERLAQRGIDASVGELALAGAEQMLVAAEASKLEEARRQALRSSLVRRVRSGEAFDSDVLLDIHEHGWARA